MMKHYLCLVTDRYSFSDAEFEKIIIEAVKGGVNLVQLREKNVEYQLFLERAFRLKSILDEFHVPLIINDNVDIALEVNADGVHLGQEDMPLQKARKIMGENAIIGVSIDALDQIEYAEKHNVTYIAPNVIFATQTKTDYKKIWGLDGIRSIKSKTHLPIMAIGNINHSNAKDVTSAGAEHLAVVSAIFKSNNPQQSAASIFSRFV